MGGTKVSDLCVVAMVGWSNRSSNGVERGERERRVGRVLLLVREKRQERRREWMAHHGVTVALPLYMARPKKGKKTR